MTRLNVTFQSRNISWDSITSEFTSCMETVKSFQSNPGYFSNLALLGIVKESLGNDAACSDSCLSVMNSQEVGGDELSEEETVVVHGKRLPFVHCGYKCLLMIELAVFTYH